MRRVSLDHIARIIEVIIGVYLLLGAVPKALDMDRFLVQMAAYRVLPSPAMLAPSALLVVYLEVALGSALILGVRLRGLTYLPLQGMLVGFTGLIVYAWRVHGLEDCGCFPLLRMPPPVSIIKNCILCGGGLFSWWRLAFRAPKQPSPAPALRKALGAATALVLGGVATAYAWHGVGEARVEYDESGMHASFDQFVFDSETEHHNLGQGVYLVPILSMSCDECMEKVPMLNELALNPAMPPMVALCYEDRPGDMEAFRAFAMPMFALYNLSDRAMLYYTLRGDAPFRLSLVQDGRQMHAWDNRVPDTQEVLDTLGTL